MESGSTSYWYIHIDGLFGTEYQLMSLNTIITVHGIKKYNSFYIDMLPNCCVNIYGTFGISIIRFCVHIFCVMLCHVTV